MTYITTMHVSGLSTSKNTKLSTAIPSSNKPATRKPNLPSSPAHPASLTVSLPREATPTARRSSTGSPSIASSEPLPVTPTATHTPPGTASVSPGFFSHSSIVTAKHDKRSSTTDIRCVVLVQQVILTSYLFIWKQTSVIILK